MVLTIFCGKCFQKKTHTPPPFTPPPFLSIAGAKSSPDPDELVASAPDPTTARVNVVGVTLGGVGLLVLGGEKPAAWDRNLVLKKNFQRLQCFRRKIFRKAVAFLGFEIFRGAFCLRIVSWDSRFITIFSPTFGFRMFFGTRNPSIEESQIQVFLGLWDVRPFSWSLRAVFSRGGVGWLCLILKWIPLKMYVIEMTNMVYQKSKRLFEDVKNSLVPHLFLIGIHRGVA